MLDINVIGAIQTVRYLMYVNNKCCFEIHLNFVDVQFDVVTIPFYSITMNIDAIKGIKRKIGLYSLR